MYLEQVQSPSAQPTINVSAKLIASIKILQYSAEELEQAIAHEVSDNPALEVDESAQCQRCGSLLRAGICPACDGQKDNGEHDPQLDIASWDDLPVQHDSLSAADDSDYDPFDFVRSAGTLNEHLTRQLGAILPAEDLGIGEFLVGNLSSHGYLTISISEAAEMLRVSEARVESALAALQSLDPPGIGARDLRECLLIQLRAFEDAGTAHPVARPLVEGYLHALGEHHFADIARVLGVTGSQVKQAWQFVRSNLNPYPGHVFEYADVPEVGLATGGDRNMVVRPDVVIRRTEHGFEAEVIERRRYRFGVNATYSSLYRDSRVSAGGRYGLSEHDRQHIREYAARARFFMDCIRQRWETLSTIASALIEHQFDFLDRGVRYLHPLTRGELANYVGLHESTVSRATANKYVQLPNGRTISFDEFFDGSLVAKDMLRELIEAENPRKPYSDEELAELLHERGMTLARRTVAKYREALDILPSRFRI
ncbi:MAG TPA: RNA polymerase factor sigma-54 [Ktedonobacterales bacterium]|nr:RNA polymerase factor sigma-54 [Ktedonobacterales bacterium]